MRNTLQRQMILDAVQTMRNHPTAEDVYLEIQKRHPTISKSTVYRNLHQLSEEGAIHPVLIPDSPERFDDRLSQHYHFCCKTCGDIYDVDMEYLARLNETVQDCYGFQVDEHDVIFKGICRTCKTKGRNAEPVD